MLGSRRLVTTKQSGRCLNEFPLVLVDRLVVSAIEKCLELETSWREGPCLHRAKAWTLQTPVAAAEEGRCFIHVATVEAPMQMLLGPLFVRSERLIVAHLLFVVVQLPVLHWRADMPRSFFALMH